MLVTCDVSSSFSWRWPPRGPPEEGRPPPRPRRGPALCLVRPRGGRTGRIGRPDGHGGRRLLVHLAHPFGPAAVVGTTEAEVPPIELVEWVPSPCWSRAAGCLDEPLVVIVPRIRSEKGGRAHETRSSANLRGVWSTA